MGSKNRTPPASIYADLEIVRSPSHTVGLERAIREYEYEKSKLSPSHTVGLERPDFFYRRRKIGSVTIPHGGLGTYFEVRKV